MKVEGQIDSETGEFLGTNKPWWAFLVSGEDSDQTMETENNDNSTSSGMPVPGTEDIEETIVLNDTNSSG